MDKKNDYIDVNGNIVSEEELEQMTTCVSCGKLYNREYQNNDEFLCPECFKQSLEEEGK